MRIFIILVLLQLTSANANSKLELLTKLSMEHLAQNLSPQNREIIKKQIDSINSELLYLSPKQQSYILELSLKNKILNNSLIKNQALSISTTLIEKVEEKIKKSKQLYSNFSLKVMELIVADYKPFFEAGFINRYQSYDRTNPRELKMYTKLLSTLKLTSHWIHTFLNSSAEEFEISMTNIIFEAFNLAKEKAYYFKQFTVQDEEKSLVFNIKLSEDKKSSVNEEDNLKEAVKDIDSGIFEKASEQIDTLIPGN